MEFLKNFLVDQGWQQICSLKLMLIMIFISLQFNVQGRVIPRAVGDQPPSLPGRCNFSKNGTECERLKFNHEVFNVHCVMDYQGLRPVVQSKLDICNKLATSYMPTKCYTLVGLAGGCLQDNSTANNTTKDSESSNTTSGITSHPRVNGTTTTEKSPTKATTGSQSPTTATNEGSSGAAKNATDGNNIPTIMAILSGSAGGLAVIAGTIAILIRKVPALNEWFQRQQARLCKTEEDTPVGAEELGAMLRTPSQINLYNQQPPADD